MSKVAPGRRLGGPSALLLSTRSSKRAPGTCQTIRGAPSSQVRRAFALQSVSQTVSRSPWSESFGPLFSE
eukprot:4671116-Pyramimonas_sp.AAC.1